MVRAQDAWTLRKWKALFAIWFQDGLAYRTSGLIWIMTDVVTAVTMPLVWAAAAHSGRGINGFQTGDLVLYYLCMLLLGSFITCHLMWDVAMEIKEGQFSTALVRPISYFQFSFFRNVSWRVIRMSLFAPFFLVILWTFRGMLAHVSLNVGLAFWASLVLGHLVSFTVVMALAMLALYTQEVFSIFELYYIPSLFLSGQLFPVALLPAWAVKLAHGMPFYYTTGAPTEILIGRLQGPGIVTTLACQVAWAIGAYGLSRVMWAKGLKHYTGVGM